MGQFSKVLLVIDNAYTVPQRALDWGPDLGGLNQVYGLNYPTQHMHQCAATILQSVITISI